jgi:hypothetical protein
VEKGDIAMLTLSSILLIVALVLFVLAAFAVPVPRINLIGAGLAFVTLAELIARFYAH